MFDNPHFFDLCYPSQTLIRDVGALNKDNNLTLILKYFFQYEFFMFFGLLNITMFLFWLIRTTKAVKACCRQHLVTVLVYISRLTVCVLARAHLGKYWDYGI